MLDYKSLLIAGLLVNALGTIFMNLGGVVINEERISLNKVELRVGPRYRILNRVGWAMVFAGWLLLIIGIVSAP